MMILQQTRGALSSGDQLALDLPFAATKSLTARLGPTPTFTRASSGTFVGSNGLIQTAAVNAARFDHDPITGICRGLLIEESRTNLNLQSEGFSTGSWQKSGSTITADSIASPDGTVTADLFNEDSGLSSHIVQQAVPSVTAGQSYTFSIFAKAASHTSFQIALSTTAFGGGLFANFVLTGSGSVGTSNGLTTSIQSLQNGWYRCSVTISSAGGGSGGFTTIVANNNNSSAARLPSYQGTGAQVAHLWGAQLELGSFATSYIPTTATSVVRSADVCSITGAAFTSFCNQTEGTLSLKSTILGATYAGGVMLSAANRFNCSVITARLNSTTISSSVRYNYGTPANFLFTNNTYGSENRTIIAFKQNDFAASSNGSTVLTDNLGEFDTNIYPLTQMHIGSDIGTRIFGWISEIKYYRRRLSNPKLQALSAL